MLVILKFREKLKGINKKKVSQGEIIQEPSCFIGFPPPYPPETDYWEIVLEKCQFLPDFGNNSPTENVRIVFFDEKINEDFEKKFEALLGGST